MDCSHLNIFYEDYTFYIGNKTFTTKMITVKGTRGEYIQGKEPSGFTGTANHQYFTGSIAATSLAS